MLSIGPNNDHGVNILGNESHVWLNSEQFATLGSIFLAKHKNRLVLVAVKRNLYFLVEFKVEFSTELFLFLISRSEYKLKLKANEQKSF